MPSSLGALAVLPRELRDMIYVYFVPPSLSIVYPAHEAIPQANTRAKARRAARQPLTHLCAPPSTTSSIFVPRAYCAGRVPSGDDRSSGSSSTEITQNPLLLLWISRTVNQEYLATLSQHTTFGFDINIHSPLTSSFPQSSLDAINNISLDIDTRLYKTARAADFPQSGLVQPPKDAEAIVAAAINRFTSTTTEEGNGKPPRRRRGTLHLTLHLFPHAANSTIFKNSGSETKTTINPVLKAIRHTTAFKTIIIELIPHFFNHGAAANENATPSREERIVIGSKLQLDLNAAVLEELGEAGFGTHGYGAWEGKGEVKFVVCFWPGESVVGRKGRVRMAMLAEVGLLRKFEGGGWLFG